MSKRKRINLVPDDASEIFEIRLVLYRHADGDRGIGVVVSSPHELEVDSVDLVDLEGALQQGAVALRETYERVD